MEQNRLFGLGEPFSMCVLEGTVKEEETFSLIEALGVTAFREWMHIPLVLSDSDTVRPEALETYGRILNRFKAMDIEVTGLNHEWFLAGENLKRGHNEIYRRDLTEGSLYMQTLELLERSWATMARAFPQVEQWEVGNEWNLDTFLHPIGWEYGTPGFSEDEKMDIAVDLMYFSARGIRRGNPKAKVVSFSPAVTQPNLGGRGAIYYPPAYGMTLAISRVYERIKSGNFWSTNTDDYFDMIALHPYMLTQIMPMAASETYPAERRFFRSESPDAAWRAPLDMVYTVMSMNGDGKKQMLLTEMGFSDWGIPGLDEKQAAMQAKMFGYVQRSMPYVKTIHTFRLYCPDHDVYEPGFNPQGERCFGLFEKDENGVYHPRKKAFALQKIYGGIKELK